MVQSWHSLAAATADYHLQPCSMFIVTLSWEYCIKYRSKPEILKLFTVLKSIEYRTSNIEYRWYWKIVFFFCLFSPKRLYSKAKNTHFWKSKSPRLPPPLIQEQFVKKCLKKGRHKIPLKKRLYSSKFLKKKDCLAVNS